MYCRNANSIASTYLPALESSKNCAKANFTIGILPSLLVIINVLYLHFLIVQVDVLSYKGWRYLCALSCPHCTTFMPSSMKTSNVVTWNTDTHPLLTNVFEISQSPTDPSRFLKSSSMRLATVDTASWKALHGILSSTGFPESLRYRGIAKNYQKLFQIYKVSIYWTLQANYIQDLELAGFFGNYSQTFLHPLFLLEFLGQLP